MLRAGALGTVRDAKHRGATIDPLLIVRDGARVHCVAGGALAGVRLDLAGDPPAYWPSLIFHLTIDPSLPVQLAELARLRDFLVHGGAPRRKASVDDRRAILALRTLDALAERASLRDIGLGIAGGDTWPGDGEWVKSRARRLVDAARAMWAGGPRRIFARASNLVDPARGRGA